LKFFEIFEVLTFFENLEILNLNLKKIILEFENFLEILKYFEIFEILNFF
jgi:hypothetical protein